MGRGRPRCRPKHRRPKQSRALKQKKKKSKSSRQRSKQERQQSCSTSYTPPPSARERALNTYTEVSSGTHHQDSLQGLQGLVNLGNTCYMNSALQCLSHTPPLQDYFGRKALSPNLGKNADLAHAFSQLLQEMWSGETASVRPDRFKRSLGRFPQRFAGSAQQDSQEFLTFLLEGLHEDVNTAEGEAVDPRSCDSDDGSTGTTKQLAKQIWDEYLENNRSCIVDIFQGQMRSLLTCGNQECQQATPMFEVFTFLSVPLPNEVAGREHKIPSALEDQPHCTLEDCLELMTKETSSGGINWFCTDCNKPAELKKKVDIWKAPEHLIVYLKRFRVTMFDRYKVYSFVKFPMSELNLSPYTENPDDPEVLYDLFAVINHRGSVYGGHYFSYALCGDKWYCFDDEIVTSIEPERVVTADAYVLFYSRSTTKKHLEHVTTPESEEHRGKQVPDPSQRQPSSDETMDCEPQAHSTAMEG